MLRDAQVPLPPARASKIMTWLTLVVILAIASAPMLIELGVPDVVDQDEALALVTAVHTRQAHLTAKSHRPFRAQDMVPQYNGRQQLQVVPGACWVHVLTLNILNHPLQDTVSLITLLRYVSVAFALLSLAMVYWCGFSIGGPRTASLAALICAANPVFIYYARLASPAMIHVGWSLMSVAAALWAIRPFKPPPSPERQLVGWLICGLALGAATLTAGPITAITVVMPILLLMLLCQDRVGHLMGLLAAMFMGMLTVMPWALYVHEQDSTVWQQWLIQLSLDEAGTIAQMTVNVGRRSMIILLAALPWTFWYISAAIQPLSTSSKGQRVRMLLGLIWFVMLAMALGAMPQGDNPAHLLVALPASAVMLGQLFSHYTELASAAHYARFWRWLRLTQVVIVVAGSVLVPLVLFTAPPRFDTDAIALLLNDPQRWPVPGASMAILLILAMYSARWAAKNYPAKAASAWAIWTIVLLGIGAATLSHTAQAQGPVRNDAAIGHLARLQVPVYMLGHMNIDPAVLLYARKPMPPINTLQLQQLIDEDSHFYLVAPGQLTTANEKLVWVESLPSLGMQLWRFGSINHE